MEVTTLEQAISYTGMSLPSNISSLPADVQAFLKLRIIVAAYNGLTSSTLNQFPKYSIKEYGYFPLFAFNQLMQLRYGWAAVLLEFNNVPCGRLTFKDREACDDCCNRFFDLWKQLIEA